MPAGPRLELVRERARPARRSGRRRPCSSDGCRGSGSCAGASRRSRGGRAGGRPRSRGSPAPEPCRCRPSAGKKTPGATSRSASVAVSVYSRTRPGWCGSAGGRIEQRVEVRRPADGRAPRRRPSPRGPSSPSMWFGGERSWTWPEWSCALGDASAPSANLPTSGTAASGAAAASSFPRVRRVLAIANSESECNLRRARCQRRRPISPSPSRTT